jgi:DNA-directed RNA polymerase specialized sigma24 family protein
MQIDLSDVSAIEGLIRDVTPVVRARVARVLARRGRRAAADIDDLVQETFAHLFAEQARALRAWDPARGLPFLGFVGLLAERAARMALRARKRDPWLEQPTADAELSELCEPLPAGPQIEARDELRRLFALAEQRLSDAGVRYLQWLVLEDRSVDAITLQTGATANVVYTWRTRIKRLLQELRVELNAESA